MTPCRWLGRIVLAVSLLASAGSADAQDFDVGLSAYAAGDYATALREWSELANQGDVEAQFSLGELYDRGQGVAQSETKAAEWYARAAELGHQRSRMKLASMYAGGRGVPKDAAKAVALWAVAAEHGSTTAQARLAKAYRGGDGVAKDLVAAQRWYQKAADGGDGAARVELFEVTQEIQREAEAAAEMSLASAPALEPAPVEATETAHDATAATAEVEHGVAEDAAPGVAEETEHAAPEETEHAATEETEHAATEETGSEPDVSTESGDPYDTLIAKKQAVVLSLAEAPDEDLHEPAESAEPAAAAETIAPVESLENSEEHGAASEPAITKAAHDDPVATVPAAPETSTEPVGEHMVAETTPTAEHGVGEPTTAEPVVASVAIAEPVRAVDLEKGTTFRVWLASFDEATAAQTGWQDLVERHGDVLAALTPFVVAPDRARGEDLFRLQAGPFATATEAQGVCQRLGQRDADCVAVAP